MINATENLTPYLQAEELPPEPPAVNVNNLAASLSPEALDKIGRLVVEEFNADVASRKDYDERRAGWVKLFAGVRGKKTWPWDNASNTHLPLFATACLQFQSRSYEALIGKDIARCYSKDGNFQDAATRAGGYMNWQLRYDMEEWEEDMDAGLMMLPMFGSMYKKTYYDSVLGRVTSRLIGPDEFVTPYRCRRLEDASRKTHIIYPLINDVKKYVASGEYINGDKINIDESESWAENTPMPETRAEQDKIESQEESQKEYIGRKVFLEMHRLLDLNYDPDNNGFLPSDGIQRPYVVTVHRATQKVVRIIPRIYWDNDRKKWQTLEHFTCFPFIPNPESHYAYGFGHFIDHINETADTIINQLIDAGTLANLQGGFISKKSGVKKGNLSFYPGEYKEVDVPVEDINKAIYQMNFKEPSNVLFALLGLLQDYVKDLTTTADWMSGKLPPSDTAATTMLAVIEQGLKVFSVIQKRCHRSLGKELKKIYILNRLYLDETVYYAVQDSAGREMKSYTSGAMDFRSNIEVIPSSDPNITSRAERLLKAQQVLADVRQNPLTANDPEANYYATLEYYEALEAKNIDAILKKPEPQEPPDIPPLEENAMMLKEVYPQPLPIQDQIGHIGAHQAFMNSTWGQMLTPQGKKLLDAHLMEHYAFAYLAEQQDLQVIAAQQAALGGTNGVQRAGREGMEGTPPDAAIQGEPERKVIRGSAGISQVRDMGEAQP